MNLNDYRWSMNPRGMHNKGASYPIDAGRMAAIKMGWVKIVATDREFLNVVPDIVARGITPIVRLWRPGFGTGAIPQDMIFAWQEYMRLGVRWFEFLNEPNLGAEWPQGRAFSYADTAGTIAPLMQTWMAWAELMIGMGAYPAFPALSDAATPGESTPRWMDAMLSYARDNFLDRFRNIIGNGMWCAVHSVTFNHFYQEMPGNPRVPRAPEQENGLDGGWHFEYPYDPICQSDDPGRTFWGGTPLSPNGDPNGLTATGAGFMQRLSEWFGGNMVPVISTEGGIEPLPYNGPQQPDPRYPPYDRNSHAEATLGMFNYIATVAPPWMFGLCLWKDDAYFDTGGEQLPVIKRLYDTPATPKTVPAVPTLGEKPVPTPVLPSQGPGYVHGQPDYHFVYLSPNFSVDWFFATAHDYWDRFRPTLIPSIDYVNYLPPTKSLVLTVLATPAESDALAAQIKQRWFTVQIDMLAVQKPDDLTVTLQQRLVAGKPYG